MRAYDNALDKNFDNPRVFIKRSFKECYISQPQHLMMVYSMES